MICLLICLGAVVTVSVQTYSVISPARSWCPTLNSFRVVLCCAVQMNVHGHPAA